MNLSHLNIGILHSLIGKNDGVSIVIDQTVHAMVHHMNIPLGNIFFLAAHISPRFNSETDEVFWHKNELHRKIISSFSGKAPDKLEEEIDRHANYAKKVIADFVERHDIDLLIAHNVSHPYNFITAVGIGLFIEERRRKGLIWPKILVWWHDSYFERESFRKPNPVIAKFMKYLPPVEADGIAFINNEQRRFARKHFRNYAPRGYSTLFTSRSAVIPNTCEIPWDWKELDWTAGELMCPRQDNYNKSFFSDIGLTRKIEMCGHSLENTVILLQHTRVVPRKRIDVAIDFAYALAKKFRQKQEPRCVALIVSGPSGDEQEPHKQWLKDYARKRQKENPGIDVVIVFGEKFILSHRDIIVDHKYYRFREIPSIIAAAGGLGTYFSELEGFGNNLLEMISFGLPAVINRYNVYKNEIQPYGFELPSVDNCRLSSRLVQQAYELLTDMRLRNKTILNNLQVLDRRLGHQLIARKMLPLIQNILFRA
ncbi:MAG: hypothetical protein JW808_08185 [Victivallales bacterium]|nr:hypothetical protein [Victivallales bacterium]